MAVASAFAVPPAPSATDSFEVSLPLMEPSSSRFFTEAASDSSSSPLVSLRDDLSNSSLNSCKAVDAQELVLRDNKMTKIQAELEKHSCVHMIANINEDTVVIKCGSETIPGPGGKGYLTYIFKLLLRPEMFLKQLKSCRAICSINHFLHNIAEDILQASSSLSHSKDEVSTLESYSSIQSKFGSYRITFELMLWKQ